MGRKGKKNQQEAGSSGQQGAGETPQRQGATQQPEPGQSSQTVTQDRGGSHGRGQGRGRGGVAQGQGRGGGGGYPQTTGEPSGPWTGQEGQGMGRGQFDQGRGRGQIERGGGRGQFDQGRGRGQFDQGRGRGQFEQGGGRGQFDQGRGRGQGDQRRGRGQGRGIDQGDSEMGRGSSVPQGPWRGQGDQRSVQGDQERTPGPPPGMQQQRSDVRSDAAPSVSLSVGPDGDTGRRGPAPSKKAEQVSMQLARINLGDNEYVRQSRTQPGTIGRKIQVQSNHLDLNLGTIKVAYHYDVEIDPDKPKKYMQIVVDSFMRKHFPTRYPSFDGRKNIYSSRPLTNNLGDIMTDTVTVQEEDGRTKEFKIQIKFANEVDMSPLRNFLDEAVTPQEAIQVVDIVLRMAPRKRCFPVGRSFFMRPEGNIIDLGGGMEMYHGFYQSAIRGWKPLLNVDVAHKAFPQAINTVDALMQTAGDRYPLKREDLPNLRSYQLEGFSKYIKGLRVSYEIPGQSGTKKCYKVNGIGDSASRARFINDGVEMTVEAYFDRVKHYRLRYPFLPTLWVGNPQRPDKILLPMELCQILEGQAVNRRMNEQQTSSMIRQAATNTEVRKNKIMRGVDMASYNNDPCVQEFGFSVGSEFQKLTARVLPPPELQYLKSKANVAKGVWRSDLFVKPTTVSKWTFVNATRYPLRPDEVKKAADMFQRSGRDSGMIFESRPDEPFLQIPGRQSYLEFERFFKEQKPKGYNVIFVIVPDSGTAYSFVKKAAETVAGCLTQCIKQSTLSRKMTGQTAANILLKVNTKLKGINHTLAKRPPIFERPVMIMGADVTHPAPDSRDVPSVAAVTASHDPKGYQYNICWRLQDPRKEIIEDLANIVEEQLMFFYKNTGCKPERIVFFRDGVSEGQFQEVRTAEIRAIRAACRKVQADGYEPKVTFLVVQKRHHTRLFPCNPKDSEDKNLNVPAGTCVDTDIVHPFLQDFYLVSHASIQGVAKPTKYVTLWDENDFKNNDIELLTFHLCHMFSRCNRSVSYPAPTYYAHLAAARAKVYIENDRLNISRLQEEFQRFQIKDEIRHGLPMFFV